MAQIFQKWTNRIPLYALVGASLGTAFAVGGGWYFLAPEFTDVGYQPVQPVPFSHRLHVGELQIDCRYCHSAVEEAAVASIPPTQTCMNCHKLVARESEKLTPVRDSAAEGKRLRWIRVHKLPEYVYFDHSLHIRAQIGCSSCHGSIAEMDEIRQVEPLSMGWCLDCHRDPYRHVRPAERITDTTWESPEGVSVANQGIAVAITLNPPTDCSGCHR